MKSKLIAFTLFAATAGVVIAYPLRNAGPDYDPNAGVTIAKRAVLRNVRPKVEVVFVLDTTGSMSGLIQAAKENIWSIASTMASAKPAPDIKMGLVAFRDRGDDYVTKVVPLSSDLDSMYATLMDFQANGGGDGPESVNQGLYDAVHRMSWSQDKGAYKVIFLVGDAPPHMDYQDDVKYPTTLKVARERGIVVNTIQAGNDPATQGDWQQIARLNQGAYFQVGQGGDAVAVATPFDEKIAALSKDLDATRMFYGTEEKRRQMAGKEAATSKLHAAASPASRAKRAEFNASAAGAGNLLGDSELVDDVTSGRVELDAIPPSSLPEPVRALDKKEQERLIRENAAKRAELKVEIGRAAEARQDYIAKQLKDVKGVDKSLDQQIFNAVRDQAAAKGLKYEEAPKY